jgi:hypothetical protein
MKFKPSIPGDDVEKIANDMRHDVRVGANAKISLGSMRTANVRVTAIGSSGITAEDAKGRAYHFRWQHVIGPTREEADDVHEAASREDDPMEKSMAELKEAIRRFSGGR